MLKRILLFVVIGFCGATSFVLFLPNHLLVYLAGRGNLFESQQTICSFAASVLFFIKYIREIDGNGPGLFITKRNIFFLFMAIGTFFVFGETISWGQRIFYFPSLAALAHINMQAETNIHNLEVFEKNHFLNMKFLFPKILLIYFFLIPVLNKCSKSFSRFFKKINLPIIPLSFGIVFITIILKFRMFSWDRSLCLQQAYLQVKQSDIIFFVMIIACWFLFYRKDPATIKREK